MQMSSEGIEDITDENRPAKLVQDYRQLYEREYTNLETELRQGRYEAKEVTGLLHTILSV